MSKAKRMLYSSFFVLFVLFSLCALGACGKVEDGALADAAPGGGPDVGGEAGVNVGTARDAAVADGTVVPFDAGRLEGPDAGPVPTLPCADASVRCPLPPSVCLNEQWLRYYASGRCDIEAGACLFEVRDVQCPPAPMPPDCYQGGCRITVIR